ncbi:MAG: PIN domain-containing protein, partial [Planctomycetaceae bacterium]|nr:PIN domain-containing protein [Planctomycetaceae bacterium]
MVQRVYVDTSVVGGKFDKEFALLTTPFWNAVFNGKITILVSDILEKELEDSPVQVSEFFMQLQKLQIERVVSTEESDHLAKKYIAENVVGRSSENDCKHIALATIHRVDCLVSWNFKHIVNI